MKKIFLFLAVASIAFFTSCNNDDDINNSYVDNDTYAESFDVNVDFLAPDNYSVLIPLDPPIFNSDVVLVYRRTTDNEGFAVWQQIPRTIFLPGDAEIDYDFNFDSETVQIFMTQEGADLSALPQYTLNQTFKIVLVPAFVAQNVDTNNIDAVMSAVHEYNNGGVPSIQK